jgi:hypothetical protein
LDINRRIILTTMSWLPLAGLVGCATAVRDTAPDSLTSIRRALRP